VICAGCGFESNPGARFCGRCGRPLENTCSSCGARLDPALAFCTACGAPVDSQERARAGEERKVVSVLFADLVGFTSRAEQLDPEDVRAVLAPYYGRLRSELVRFGGTVEKFIGDAVVALFGAPVSHEDDPERAVRAALAVRAAIAQMNEAEPDLELRMRIAVTTGEAIVALGSRPVEGEGMAAGDVMNTASRLQNAAPVDGILVDETTHRATGGAIEYRQADPVRVKGKTGPIDVWEAIAARPAGADERPARETTFVGRAKELDLLLDALARARDESAPQLVTVVGVPGIGKSRLVREFLRAVRRADDGSLTSLHGRSLPYGDGVTFWALGEMAKLETGILASDAADIASEKLSRAVRAVVPDEREADWVDQHLRPLVGLGGETREDQRNEAFAAWRRFFEALAQRAPLVLVFEDLHWGDDALLGFVDDLVEWISNVPLLVVCTARPEFLARRSAWGGGKRNATTVSLSPLTGDQTARLVGLLLEQPLLPAELQSALLERAGGNPLYAQEYVRMLADRGLLTRAGGGWRLEPAEQLPLPESVQGIMAARLDGLPPDEKALLQDAAVLGYAFWTSGLAAVARVPRNVVEARLHALERKEFLRRGVRSSLAGESQYSFLHVLVRDVAYRQIPRARRGEKHQLAAEWLESLTPDRAEDWAEMLAHHYLSALELAGAAGHDAAQLAERARLACRDAGDRASALNAFAPAARFYSAALELWPRDDPGRAQLLLRYGRALFHSEGGGAESLAEAETALLALGDYEGAAHAELTLGQLAWWRGERDRAFDHHERAAELVADLNACEARARALANLAGLRMVAGEHEAAIRGGWEALQLAEELDLDDLRAAALNTIGCARAGYGDLGGIVDLERSIAIAEERNSPASIRSYANLADLTGRLGDLRRRFELQARALQSAQRFGDRNYIRWLEALRVTEHYCRGRWDEALRVAETTTAEWAGREPEIVARLVRGRIRLARGNVAGALEDAAAAHALGGALQQADLLYPAVSFEAVAVLESGDARTAERLALDLLARWVDSECSLLAAFWVLDLARVLTEVGRGPELTDAAAHTSAKTRWLEAADAFVARDFRTAAEVLAEIGAAPEEADARLRAAEALLASGNRRDGESELARALAFYRSVGASAYVRTGEGLPAASA
jgi:class 3 adenylate cyclase